MNNNRAFSLAETLIAVGIVAILGLLILGVLTKDESKRREYLSRYEMVVPNLTEVAAYAAQSADLFEDWWAESNSLAGLNCEDENRSVCLRNAFMAVSPNMRRCDIDDCFPERDDINAFVATVLSNMDVDVEDMQVVRAQGGSTLGLLYVDSSCSMMLEGQNGRKIESCGLIFIDVNGEAAPNRLATADVVGDRYFVALTENGVKQTQLINAAAGCPAGTAYNADRGGCFEQGAHVCSVSASAVARASELREANGDDPEFVTVFYPDGDEFRDCYTARCRSGARPNAANLCPGACPAGQVYQGGMFVSEGGDIDDNNWEQKLCCTPISDADGLRKINDNLAGTYCLVNDIDLNDVENWIPLALATPFSGSLFGNGFAIRNLRIEYDSNSTGVPIGLFSKVSGTVKDLVLEDVDIRRTGIAAGVTFSVGVVAGDGTGGTFTNIITSGRVNTSESEAHTNTSGVVAQFGAYNNVINNVNIILNNRARTPKDHRVGGISPFGGVFVNVINNADIAIETRASNFRVGGIVATSSSGASENVVLSAINNGDISSRAVNLNDCATNFTGGIFGGNGNIGKVVASAINYGNISVVNARTAISGGLSGNNVGAKDVLNYGAVSATNGNTLASGAIVGKITGSSVSNAVNMGQNAGNNMIGDGAPSISNLLYLSGSIGGTCTSCNVLTTLDEDFQDIVLAQNLPPQLRRYCGLNPDADIDPSCFDVLNTPNTFIPAGENAYSMWAYRMPTVADNPYDIRTGLVLRWQCKPYKEDGLDCCRPNYADWEPELPVCPIALPPPTA